LTEAEYTAHVERRKTLLIDPPNKNRSLDEYTRWITEYKAWSAMVESVTNLDIEVVRTERERVCAKLEAFAEATREHTHMVREMAALEDDLSDVKSMDFNPECWACKKNPFAHKKTKLTKRCDAMQIKMEEYKAQLIEDELLSKWRRTIDDCDKQIEVYATYTRDKDRYVAEVTYWNDVRKAWKAYDKWKSEVDRLTDAIDAFENYRSYAQYKAYKEQEVAHKTLLDAYKTQKARLERAKARAHEASEWERVLADIEKYKEVYEAYEVWASEHAIIETNLDGLNKSIEKRRLEDLRQTHDAEYMSRKTKVDIAERYENAKNMYYSNKLHIVDAELSELTSKREELLVEKATSDASDHIVRTNKTTLDKLLYLEQTYEDRLIKIKHLDVVFMGDKTTSDGYKEWIYKSQVIPMINREMNNFLGLFENFAFLMSYDKKHFIYMLEDRGNKPTLDKASGYQNFIIGLAFRIILTRIGCIGQQMKHLFIDEGFTACDAQNIEKVPSMLKSILTYGDYASITLMSHLDSVRECASVHINIERKEPFSYIHYGDSYPIFSIYCEDTGTIVKKTKGRPKSVKN
jgi:DNA repair exonuclease SbcCD ATPase subunit